MDHIHHSILQWSSKILNDAGHYCRFFLIGAFQYTIMLILFFYQGISMQTLERKINEFNAENEMLKGSLEHAKGDFLKDINEIVDNLRYV